MVGNPRRRVNLLVILLTLLAIEAALGFGMAMTRRLDPELGWPMVKAMYSYGDDISSLEDGYLWLADTVDRDSWERIRIDTPSRYAEAYYKFKQDEVDVSPVFERQGVVLYSIKNIYINPAIPWVLTYDYANGVVTNLREYSVVGYICTPEEVQS